MRKKRRFLILRIVIVLTFALLSGRLWYVQVVMGKYYKQQGDTSKIRLEPVAALRGIIYDRNGVPLVWNIPSWNVRIVPHGIPPSQAGRIYRRLSLLLHGNPSAAKIATVVQQHEWQAYAPFVIKPNISFDTAMVIKQLHTQLPGVSADPASIRQYRTDRELSLAHILGYTGVIDTHTYKAYRHAYPREHVGLSDQIGMSGIELALDPYLHGVNGTERVEVDAGERPVRRLSAAHTIPGDKVYLTIDSKLQQAVAGDLQAGLNKLGVRQGVAIVEDVHTGAILSMVSLPSYNNNWFSGAISQVHLNALYHDPAQPLIDLATQGQFPPGSTYKIITAAAALQSGAVNADTTVDDTGSIQLYGHTFYGWKPGGLGVMNVVSALAESSDIYFYTVAGGNPNLSPDPPHAGAETLAHFARLFGLGQSTGIEIGDQPGLVPSPTWYDSLKVGDFRRPLASDSWHIGDTYNMAIGQGYNLATPLQMVNVVSTVANGGTLYQPRLVYRVVGRAAPKMGALRKPSVVEPFVPTIIRRNFIDPGNLGLIQTGMHDGVAWQGYTGTSYNVHDNRIDAAGKTGTAEALMPDGTPNPHAWWLGYAPFNNPKIAVVVMIPHADSEGATAAAPIAHKIFEDYFHLKPISFEHTSNWLQDVQHYLVPGGGGAQ